MKEKNQRKEALCSTAIAVVFATGQATYLGTIAKSITGVRSQLIKRWYIRKFSRWL